MTQKPKESEDLRIRRTRKLLQQAFIELVAEKGFADLTVRDITERAMVNRSTFYRHYLDKYDLLEQYMNEVHALTEDQASQEERQTSIFQEEPPGLLNLLKHIQRFADFYRVMLGTQGDLVFAQRFRQNTEKRFRPWLSFAGEEPEANTPPVDLRLACIAYAGMGAAVWWLEQEQPCSPEQFATWLGQISSDLAGPSRKPKG